MIIYSRFEAILMIVSLVMLGCILGYYTTMYMVRQKCAYIYAKSVIEMIDYIERKREPK